ncbi:molecular chaperone DnaJ [Sphingobium subterraneum]|uniref:J domain-containing protein n=1 Tax=Sphingobium subterraneum TaxID=627688 RepID=A0A841J3M4_9SPHN|nr:molecular chaperone DnaJ [Sphingobium subterraneum]MBB6124932.1 hypothetical protein [Sphingobium subterraneum]
MGGLLLLLVVGLAAWLVFTGRLRRMTGTDGIMLGMAIVGAAMAAKGNALIGGVPLGLALLYAWRRWQGGKRAPKPTTFAASMAETEAVAEARALLGLSTDADEAAIRAAHRHLIAKIHPDAGGTQALAEKINGARNILLRHLVERAGSHPSSHPEQTGNP